MKISSIKLKEIIRRSLSDEFIVDRQFFGKFGRHIDFYDPKTFNEKLQIQKLYFRDPRMTIMADKFRVREYIEAKGHEVILNTLIGVFDQPEDIDFDKLPDKFVIKSNHSWNTNIICDDKSSIDKSETIRKLKDWMATNHYHRFREWCYKNIEPKIIIERFLSTPLKDYKFFCFSGSPLYIQVDSERGTRHILDMYDLDWQRLDCKKGNNALSSCPEDRPEFLDKMVSIAKDLSSDFNFCRVDFLANPEGFYFAEMTFYPGGGYSPFEPEEFDYLFGQSFHVASARIPFRSRLSINAINMFNKLNTKKVN